MIKVIITINETANASDASDGGDMLVVITTPDRIRLLMTSGRVRLKVE